MDLDITPIKVLKFPVPAKVVGELFLMKRGTTITCDNSAIYTLVVTTTGRIKKLLFHTLSQHSIIQSVFLNKVKNVNGL